jgi:hypothetical protein
MKTEKFQKDDLPFSEKDLNQGILFLAAIILICITGGILFMVFLGIMLSMLLKLPI